MSVITKDDLKRAKWTTTCLDFRGGWQRRSKCLDQPVERVIEGGRGGPATTRWLVYDVPIGGTIDEAIAALNDWNIVQRALDAQSAHNNVDDGNLHGMRSRLAAAKAAQTPDVASQADQQASFEF